MKVSSMKVVVFGRRGLGRRREVGFLMESGWVEDDDDGAL